MFTLSDTTETAKKQMSNSRITLNGDFLIVTYGVSWTDSKTNF